MRVISCFFAVCCVFSFLCFGQNSPDELRQKAFSDIKAASMLFTAAVNLTDATLDKTKAFEAQKLFMQAGQLYESSSGIMASLGTNYFSQEDITQCAKAVQICVQKIKELNSYLSE
ncbi:MAG: hypothetical protein PHP69_00120 [Candidatus Omnitrophica bacterium]|nr:hypothetical protein [Candidatus Omnitrophota bacterium]MDD5081446.1 hypothetical protein [Candidatus Omnitrophota bacterium]MDD5440811.1 hypothetical protein [Candidatus Omnitrophota bacterium]